MDILACRHIGTGPSVVSIHLPYIQNADDRVDAPDFFQSSFWNDSDPYSGLGGWGQPNADFSVPDGGFKTLHLSYPSPHILRRNFTLRPFDLPLVFFTQPQMEANITFTASKIETLLETPVGDYKGFQAAFEAFEVRAWSWNMNDWWIPRSHVISGCA